MIGGPPRASLTGRAWLLLARLFEGRLPRAGTKNPRP